MSDLSTEQALRTAFGELRATEQPRIYPPGPDAARRTVRRRRRLGAASATAGLTALVAISAGYLAGTGGPAPNRRTTDPVSVAAEAPTTPAADRRRPELDRITVDALGRPAEGASSIVIGGGLAREAGKPTSITLSAKSPGSYLLRVSCGNPDGSVTAAIQAGDAEATATARCGTTADEIAVGIGETTVLAAGPAHMLRISVEPDSAAVSQGSRPVVALVLTPR